MYSYRLAEISDVDSIVALVESAYRGESSYAGWTTEADLLDGQRTDRNEVVSLITHHSSCILLCEHETEIVASVHLLNKHSYGYLGMFAVNPQLQSQGIGGLLLEQSENIVFNEWRCPALRMAVISLREDLIDWYRARGYFDTGKTMPFPYGDERYGIPKRDDLVLSVLEKRFEKQDI